jgi:hypothetical protein
MTGRHGASVSCRGKRGGKTRGATEDETEAPSFSGRQF